MPSLFLGDSNSNKGECFEVDQEARILLSLRSNQGVLLCFSLTAWPYPISASRADGALSGLLQSSSSLTPERLDDPHLQDH